MTTLSWARGAMNFIIGLALMVSFVGCSSPDPQPETCTADEQCAVGHSCDTEGVCRADVPCAPDGTCQDGGECVGGACINPDSCATGGDCIEGFFCTAEGSCAEDPCTAVTCDRGVCEVGTGACVDAAVCTSANEAVDCIEGSRCVGGACVDETTFCAEMECERGVCSFEELDCVNAASCSGDDTLCATGFYCADDTCQPNRCDAAMTDCPRGTCDGATGECVNPDSCSTSEDCLDGSLCVGGTCAGEAAACGCTGNQACDYDAAALSVECTESAEGCSSALDCVDDRQCVGGACVAPVACTPDEFEPNNDATTSTDVLAVDANGVVSNATVCAGDVDVFTFDTFSDAEQRGVFLVEIELEPSDVGLGTLTLELVDTNQSVVGTAQTQAGAGHARIEHDVTFTNAGVYTIRVSSDDATTAGVRYTLRADITDGSVVAACEAAGTLDLASPVAGNTLTANSVALTTSCGDTNGDLAEDIWRVSVPSDGQLTIQANPSTQADIAISLRSVCERANTEFGECSDRGGAFVPETLSTRVVPGDYFVVVQSTEAGGGAYSLSAVLEPTICSEVDNTCLDADTASVCNPHGTAFDTESCSFGCDAGECQRNPGDVCRTATAVNVGTGYTGFVDWMSMEPDYDPGNVGCVPNNGINSSTDGSDAVFEVDLPADNVLLASLSGEPGVYGALYVTTDCQDLGAGCVAAANAGLHETENLFYHNESGATQKLYLVADNGTIGNPTSSSVIDISIELATCTPGASRCVLDRESQVCNEAGTSYDTTILCEFGCDDATGNCILPQNDTCGGALPLVHDIETQPQDLSILANDYDQTTTGSCDQGTGSPRPGLDSTFLLSGINVGEVVTVTLWSDFNATLWVAEDCTNQAIGSCFAGADDTYSSTTPEVLQFVAPRSGDFVVVVEASSAWVPVGTFSLKYTVAPPTCVPHTNFGCDATMSGVEYCDSLGNPQVHLCGGTGCDPASGQCANPTGDVCADPIVVATMPGSAQSGSLVGAHNDGTVSGVQPSSGQHGNCTFANSPKGSDTIYSFNLAGGDLLTIDFDSSSTGGYGYLLEECTRADSCQFNMVQHGRSQYLAEQSTTVFFVVDHTYGSSSGYTADWDITPSPSLACVPGSNACSGPFTLEVCSEDGTSADYQTCPNGCSALGGCILDGANDHCANATNAGSGAFVVVDPDDYTSTIDDGCGLTTTGADAFYSVDLQPNDLLRVTGLPSDKYDDAVAYIFTDCADATSSCLDGMQMGVGDAQADVYYLATQAETVLVGLDTDSNSDSAPFYFAIEVLSPECTESDPLVCDATNTAVEYCQNGLVQTYQCAGGCSAGACQPPTGDTCWDAFDLAAMPSTIGGTWEYATALVNPGAGVVGPCIFDDYGTGAGPEDVYRIDLAAGDLLHVEETSPVTGVLYLVDGCVQPSESCLTNDMGSEVVDYYAETAETVYLVVDRSATAPTTAQYTIEWSVTQGSLCAPGQSYCLDANTAAVCLDGVNSTGAYACANGCQYGACQADLTMDSCGTAPVLAAGEGISLVYNAADYADDASVSCAGGAHTDGPDLFFQVDLQPFDIVRAKSQGVGKETPAVYIVSDCDNAESSCIAGDRGAFDSNYTVEVEHQATSSQTVFVVFDSISAGYDEPFLAQIDVLTPDCVPGQFANTCNSTGNGFMYCDETGFTRTYLCGGAGTCDATTNRCTDPVGDTCIDPSEATPTASGVTETFNGDFVDRSNDHELPVSNNCVPSWTPGADATYVVDLTAGQTLTATVVSTEVGNEQDLALYLVGDCTDVDLACLAGADGQGAGTSAESVTYTAPADESVTLIVDSFFANVFGTYQLTVTVD